VSDNVPFAEPAAAPKPPATMGAPAPEPPESAPPPHVDTPRGTPGSNTVSIVLAAAVAAILLLGGLLVWHAASKVNRVALSQSPKPVTVTTAKAHAYQPSRSYVGTLEPWLAASVGPQLVSAYIDTVLVRPGAVVKRGEVLATLDCRDASAANQSVAMAARAIDERQKALASESARVQGLLAGHFVSPNEAEQKSSASAAEAAELESMKAKLSHSTLEVNDCILRAPFDGEVAARIMDPGGFVRPGMSIVSVVDRSTVRFSTDVPEIDFAAIPPGTAVRIAVSATKQDLFGTISRRAPAADPSTRTVHFEVDLPDPTREIPVGTTGEARLDVGEPEPATEIPIYAASVRGSKATVFVVDGDVAHARTVTVKGEIGGGLFVDASLAPGARVVTEGRALLNEGDHVTATVEAGAAPPSAPAASAPRTPTVVPVKAAAPAGMKEHHQ
jgi:RND family efflux transporter MFP subunit